jgi:hypothetical protein
MIMRTKKDVLIETVVREIMKRPVFWADLIINALEWHLGNTFTEQELEETFLDTTKDGDTHGNN